MSPRARLDWDKVLERAAIGIARIDLTGRYVLVNERYCAMLGRSESELLELSIQEVTHPEDLPASLDAVIQAIESGAPAIVEQHCVRGDRSSAWISNNLLVEPDSLGAPKYVLCLAQDISVRKEAERALNKTQADLGLLLDSAADGFYCVDRDGLTTICNAAFRRLAGFASSDDVVGMKCHDAIRLMRPDGSYHSENEHPVYRAARSGIHAHSGDERLRRADGQEIPVEYWIRPIVRSGEIQGAVCNVVDITERKNAEVRQDLLNHELAHRVKNTLAVVQAIVGQSLRDAASPREALSSVNARLLALSRAHTVLMTTRWGNAQIMDVIESALAGQRPGSGRISTTGPRMDVGPKAALAITMALHELCTNATKYGALSNQQGGILLEWTVIGGAVDPLFRLSWTEFGGPPVKPPTRRGFGSRVISDSFGADFGGRADLRFEPEGVRWMLEAPLDSILR